MLLKAHAYLKITTFLSVNIYVYPKYILLYSTITTPMLIHRMKIYIIMLPPPKINSYHTSTAMCMNPKITLTSHFTYILFALLCIYSSTIRFDKLHVYKQLCMCLFTCLYKYTICSIVRPVCIIHLSRIMYLFCIQLYYVSFHTVYKMFVYYIAIYYGCVMSTYLPDSMTLINLFHTYIIFYFFFHYALKNATLPNYCRHNDPRFINRNSIKLNLLKFKCFNDLLHLPICPSCCFREQIYGRVHISILVFCLYDLPSSILIKLILVNYSSEKSLMRRHVCHLNRGR